MICICFFLLFQTSMKTRGKISDYKKLAGAKCGNKKQQAHENMEAEEIDISCNDEVSQTYDNDNIYVKEEVTTDEVNPFSIYLFFH